MTLALAAQSVAFAFALVAVVVFFLRMLDRRETAWAAERAALVNHLQFGDRLPIPAPASKPVRPAVEPTPPDEIDSVGRIEQPEPRSGDSR